MEIKKRAVALLLCLVMALSGCASQPGEKKKSENTASEQGKPEEPEQSEKVEKTPEQVKLDMIQPSAYNNIDGLALEPGTYLSVIGKAASGAFWEEVKRGAVQAVDDINKRLGYEGKDKVKVVYSGPEEAENVDEQVNILDEELARYPSAVAISIVDTQACEVQFDLAAESDIPVVAFDSGSDYKGLMSMVSTDNQKASAEAADRMADAVGSGEVVMVVHDSKSETGKVRENAFAEEMKNYPDIQISAVYHTDELKQIIADEINAGTYATGDAQPTGAALEEEEKTDPETITTEDMTSYIIKRHPQMKGCYATNSTTVEAMREAFDREGNTNVTLIGYDADEAEIKSIRDGSIAGLIVQNPYGMGYASVVAAARSALALGNEARVDTGYIWVTKDNLEEEEVEKMLY